jgi:hypothetical protein
MIVMLPPEPELLFLLGGRQSFSKKRKNKSCRMYYLKEI